MLETSNNNWGIYGCSAILAGTISFFTPGFSALFIGLTAVLLGYLGSKKRQKLSQTGALIGGIVVLYANIVNIGIIPMDHYAQSDKSHFINSLNSNIAAFKAMKDEDNHDADHENLLKHLQYSLGEARKVDIESVDNQVKGFSNHYKANFIKGTELLIEGIENNNIKLKIKGGVLLDKWASWSQANHNNLKKINEPNSLSLFSFFVRIIN